MPHNYKAIIFLLFSVMLISQVSVLAFANHADDVGSKERKKAEEKTKKIQEEKNEKASKIKAAWNEYKKAFKEWKKASEKYRSIATSGDQEKIDSAKEDLEKAIIEKNNAWAEYQKIKKENS